MFSKLGKTKGILWVLDKQLASKFFGLKICVSVCLSVCMSARSHTSKTTRPNFTKFSFSLHVTRGHDRQTDEQTDIQTVTLSSLSDENVTQTTTSSHHIRASYESTTCSCWRHWTWSSQDLFMNFTPKKSSVQWKEKTSSPRWRRSERTRSYCQCSVASLLKSFNCFSMHSTTVDSNMSAILSLTDDQVCQHFCS